MKVRDFQFELPAEIELRITSSNPTVGDLSQFFVDFIGKNAKRIFEERNSSFPTDSAKVLEPRKKVFLTETLMAATELSRTWKRKERDSTVSRFFRLKSDSSDGDERKQTNNFANSSLCSQQQNFLVQSSYRRLSHRSGG